MTNEITLDPSTNWEGLMNMRDWFDLAVTEKGAKVVGGGCGMGQADLEVEIEGFVYDITIKPRFK